MLSVTDLPGVNATLNAVSACLLLAGFLLIRSGRPQSHRLFMLAACGTSTLFLISYVIYQSGGI